MQAPDWDELYNQHADRVRAILFRMCGPRDLDDLVQDSFIKIWKGIQGFRGESQSKTWISKITMNVAYDYHRRNYRTEQPESLSPEASIEMTANSDENSPSDQVQQALQTLSLEHRDVLVLHVLEELSIEEIAKTLDVAVGTVKSRLHHAREKMKIALRKRGVHYESA